MFKHGGKCRAITFAARSRCDAGSRGSKGLGWLLRTVIATETNPKGARVARDACNSSQRLSMISASTKRFEQIVDGIFYRTIDPSRKFIIEKVESEQIMDSPKGSSRLPKLLSRIPTSVQSVAEGLY